MQLFRSGSDLKESSDAIPSLLQVRKLKSGQVKRVAMGRAANEAAESHLKGLLTRFYCCTLPPRDPLGYKLFWSLSPLLGAPISAVPGRGDCSVCISCSQRDLLQKMEGRGSCP